MDLIENTAAFRVARHLKAPRHMSLRLAPQATWNRYESRDVSRQGRSRIDKQLPGSTSVPDFS
jgi:hypothetical protein